MAKSKSSEDALARAEKLSKDVRKREERRTISQPRTVKKDKK